jgi:hypothetical protein
LYSPFKQTILKSLDVEYIDTGYEAEQHYEQRNINPENMMFHSCSKLRVHLPLSSAVSAAPLDSAEPGFAK